MNSAKWRSSLPSYSTTVRVAVLADIHGNLPALEAVLRDVDAAGADAIVLAGDMTVGPLQAETLDLLESLGPKAIWVRGNCERAAVRSSTADTGELAPPTSREPSGQDSS